MAVLLVPLQLGPWWPLEALALDRSIDSKTPATSTPQASQEVPPGPTRINRSVPAVAHDAHPRKFSALPTEAEIAGFRIFAEPLLPIGLGKASPTENRTLADAITAYAQNPTPENTAPLTVFLAGHPKSVWRVSLLTNLGLIERRGGYWSKALAVWQEAWALGQEEEDPTKKLIVDRALAELAELTVRIGRLSDMEKLVAEVGSRDIRGTATEKWAVAKESLHLMKVEPEKSFRCGPMAVGRVYAVAHGNRTMPMTVLQSISTDHGTSFEDVRALAEKLGLKYQVAFRSPGASVIVPSVVNWKVGHFAAVTHEINGRYQIQDATFTQNFLISAAALDQESSGYFLVPSGQLPTGWRPVDSEEAGKVWGKGAVPPPTKNSPPKEAPKCKDECHRGMASYDVDPSRISLTMADTPLFYTPPRGAEIAFTVHYSQREMSDSSSPNYPNLGPKWNLDWVCFFVDDPADPRTYGPGGGTLEFAGYSSTGENTGAYAPQALDQSVLERTSATTFTRHFPDGSNQIFGLEDIATSRVFMTAEIDPAGNQCTYTYDPDNFRLLAVTDALGQVTELTYASDDPDSANGDFYRIAKVTDPFGRSTSLSYNELGQLAQIVDTAGLVSQFTYGAGDMITALTTPYGTSSFLANDVGADRSLLMTDPTGAQEYIEFKFDSVIPDFAGPFPSGPGLFPYDGTQRLWQSYRNSYYWDKKAYAEAKGDYSKAHLRHWLHDSGGLAMSDTLESEKRALESRVFYNYAGQTNTVVVGTSNLVTAAGRMINDTDSQISQFDYNAQGRMTKSVSPGDGVTPSRTTTFQYADNGIDVIAVYQQNPAGQSGDPYGVASDLIASFTYKPGGQHLVATATDTAGQTTSYTYNSLGQILTTTNAKGETTTMAYDRDDDSDSVSDGYLVSITGPVAGAMMQFQYDGFGRVWKITDSDGDITTLNYDATGGDPTKTLNRIAKTTFADGTNEQILYDRLDARWLGDRLGRWTQVLHDPLQRVVGVIDPKNQLTQYVWCSCGALEALIDPAGNQTTWMRDVQSRVVQKVYPDNTVVSTEYEAQTGRVKSVTDAKSQVTHYAYNIDDSLQQVSWTGPGGMLPTPAVSYTYDPVYARVATMADGIGTTQYGYNAVTAPPVPGAGRLVTIDGPWADDTISYQYDELGRVTNRGINGAANTTTLGYDALGRLTGTTNPLGAFIYNYVGVTGRLDHLDYPNGQKTQYAYYGAAGSRRLQEIKNTDPSNAVISQFDYAYNAVGNITAWTQNHSGLTHPRQYAFGYDPVDQLTSGTLRDTVVGTTLRDQAYSYDAAGNRKSVQDGNTVKTETANGLNQIIGVTGGGPMRFAGTLDRSAKVSVGGNPAMVASDNSFEGFASVSADATTRVHIVATDIDNHVTDKYVDVTPDLVASQAFTYDANGNTVTAGPAGAPNVTYAWDAADRLVSVTLGANVTTFEYDGVGRRVREKLNGTETRHWIWCGLELCEERDNSNNVTKRFYAQGEQISGMSYFATRDHLRSMRELTDATGSLRARYDYDLYGLRSANLVTLNAVGSDFGFTGHQEFESLGLVGAPFRFYQPSFAKWLSRDPIEEDGGMNLYGYVANAPTLNIDLLGYRINWITVPKGVAETIARMRKIDKEFDSEVSDLEKSNSTWNIAQNYVVHSLNCTSNDPNALGAGKPTGGTINIAKPDAGAIETSDGRMTPEEIIAHEFFHAWRMNQGTWLGGFANGIPNWMEEVFAVRAQNRWNRAINAADNTPYVPRKTYGVKVPEPEKWPYK